MKLTPKKSEIKFTIDLLWTIIGCAIAYHLVGDARTKQLLVLAVNVLPLLIIGIQLVILFYIGHASSRFLSGYQKKIDRVTSKRLFLGKWIIAIICLFSMQAYGGVISLCGALLIGAFVRTQVDFMLLQKG